MATATDMTPTPTPPFTAFHPQQQEHTHHHQHRFERPIEIYENERMWIGRGFSQAGLLPTDRVGPYSTRDGSLSWKTLDEAIEALLLRRQGNNNINDDDDDDDDDDVKSDQIQQRHRRGRGWSFHEADDANGSPPVVVDEIAKINDAVQTSDMMRNTTVDTKDDHDDYHGFIPSINSTTMKKSAGGTGDDGEAPTDEYGWNYYPDFSPRSLLTSYPNCKRGMLDFVRRRKLTRTVVFRPDHFLSREVYAKCDFCDSNVVNMLSDAMLDALALAALLAHGSTDTISNAQALELKCKLVDTLSIGKNCALDQMREGEVGIQTSDYDPWVGIEQVKDRLCTFAEACVGKRHGLLAHLLHQDSNDVHQNIATFLPDMRKFMSRYLGERERQILARLLIKDIDRHSYKLHCSTDYCSQYSIDAIDGAASSSDSDNLCKFRLVSCSNAGCDSKFSFLHQIQHDEEVCQYKLLPCPNGCGVELCRKDVPIHIHDTCNRRPAKCPLAEFGCNGIVQAQDLAQHLNESADRHFVLLSHRMLEYQTVMKDMSYHIRLLEENNARLERELQAAVLANVQSQHGLETVSNDVKRMTKRLGTLESTCRTEFKKVEHDRRSNRK